MTIREAVHVIRQGGVVAYPTESFYALGADATNARAVRKVFNLKGRGKLKPIALIAGNRQQVERFFTMTKTERSLAHRYWPGAVTILLRPKKVLAADALLGTTPSLDCRSGHSSLTSPNPLLNQGGGVGGGRIGVRVPSHAPARALALYAGVPITATSANRSGQLPTKLAAKVERDFPGILVLPGRCGRQRRPSTVVVLSGSRPVVLRRGQVKI